MNKGKPPQKHGHHLVKLLSKGQYQQVLQEVEPLMSRYPKSALLLKIKGTANLELYHLEQAVEDLEEAESLTPDDGEVLYNLGIAYYRYGDAVKGIRKVDRAIEKNPGNLKQICAISKILIDSGYYSKALEYLDRIENAGNMENSVLMLQADAYYKLQQLSKALEIYNIIDEKFPEDLISRSNLANTYRMLGQFDKAEQIYQDVIACDPSDIATFSNYFYSMHYNPAHTAQNLWESVRNWDNVFAPKQVKRQHVQDKNPNRRLRIGFISGGLRLHPVGNMITSALEHLPESEVELIAYSLNYINDRRAQRIKKRFDQWYSVIPLNDADLADRIRKDRIDILFDMCGHSEGQRLMTIALKPAPLIVKWVGGLINTTGPSAMDYLVSDSVETPEGVDDRYVENLIRLPDDYICYLPPESLPDVGPLPAENNGFITLGCFNNPSKLNDKLVEHWAAIMQALPNSRILLKGGQYEAKLFVDQITEQFAVHGIEADRLLIEPFSLHYQLLETYNRVDIALDPWPYSGGLTTCEALLMGVPVVTMPGPTFAGRHSATHLVNAGLPELVADDWETYHRRVLELATDLQSLKIIRQELRKQLLSSPVCDAPRFARHFTIAMRAIWHRYCEGKPPVSLTFEKDGTARFAGESVPVQIEVTEIKQRVVDTSTESDPNKLQRPEFDWELPSKILVIDNGTKLLRHEGFQGLLNLNAFGIVAFDAASRIANADQFAGNEHVQLLPHAVLGDGQPATLYACLDPALSAPLSPLPADQLPESIQQDAKVLTKLPINTVALDSIQGLNSLDWLILDDLSDASSILEHGHEALKDTLLIQVRIAFRPTHERQPNLAELQHWAARHNFRFYRFNDMAYASHFPDRNDLLQEQSTELIGADALFLPSPAQMDRISNEQRIKLAFLLHTVFRVKDLTYELLAQVDQARAEAYLIAEGIIPAPQQGEVSAFDRNAIPSELENGPDPIKDLELRDQLEEEVPSEFIFD